MAVTPLSYLSESTLSIADSASAILSARPVTTATLSTMRYFIYQILKFRFSDTKIPQSSDIHTKNPPGISARRVRLENGTGPWVA